MKIKRVWVCVITTLLLLSGQMVYASGQQNSLKPTKSSTKSKISGTLNIKLDVGKVKNVISGSGTENQATVRIGTVSASEITGTVDIGTKSKPIKVKNVINEIGGGNRNKAIVNIAAIEKSKVKDASFEVDLQDVTNKTGKGDNNKAIVNIATISGSEVKGKATLKVKAKANIINEIGGGSDNKAFLDIASIKNSKVTNADIEVTTEKEVTNKVHNGKDNRAIMKLGVIENSEGVDKAEIKVTAKGVLKNEVLGGSGNVARMQIGGITNATKANSVNIEVVTDDVTNQVSGKSNVAEVSLGFVD